MLHQIRLDHVLDAIARFRECCGQSFHADRPAAIRLHQSLQIAAIEHVEPIRIHFQPLQRRVREFRVDGPMRRIGEIAHAAQQPHRHTRRAARALGDFDGAFRRQRRAELHAGILHDRDQLFRRIEIEPHRNAEAVAQRIAEQPRARRGADQRERRKIDAHAARARAFADDDVEVIILHRGIKDFLHRRREAMDFIDEQHVARFEIGEKRREIARARDHRPGGGAKTDAQFARQNLRERGLAQARRPEQQHVIQRLAAPARSLHKHFEIGLGRGLADEFIEALRPERAIRALPG